MTMRGVRKPGAPTDHLGGARPAARRRDPGRGDEPDHRAPVSRDLAAARRRGCRPRLPALGPRAAGDGRRQRHARLVLRRRPLRSTPTRAIAHGLAAARRRAPTSSTSAASRPGPAPTGSTAEEELRRVLPVIAALAADGRAASASTRCAPRSPRRRSTAGAALVNDVRGGLADPTMLRRGRRARRAVRRDALARAQRATMHAAGPSTTTWSPRCAPSCAARRRRVVGRRRRPDAGRARPGARLRQDRASTTGRCWPSSTGCTSLGRPVLVGASPQAFLGPLLADGDGAPRPAAAREDATAAVTALAAAAGAWAVRVHDARASATP